MDTSSEVSGKEFQHPIFPAYKDRSCTKIPVKGSNDPRKLGDCEK